MKEFKCYDENYLKDLDYSSIPDENEREKFKKDLANKLLNNQDNERDIPLHIIKNYILDYKNSSYINIIGKWVGVSHKESGLVDLYCMCDSSGLCELCRLCNVTISTALCRFVGSIAWYLASVLVFSVASGFTQNASVLGFSVRIISTHFASVLVTSIFHTTDYTNYITIPPAWKKCTFSKL